MSTVKKVVKSKIALSNYVILFPVFVVGSIEINRGGIHFADVQVVKESGYRLKTTRFVIFTFS